MVSSILHGSWSDQIISSWDKSLTQSQVSLLIDSGAAGLAWNSVKKTHEIPKSEFESQLNDQYRNLAILELLDNRFLRQLDDLLFANNIDAILFKGRGISPYYFPSHIRPTGDVDVVVSEKQFQLAVDSLTVVSARYTKEPSGEYVFTLHDEC